MLKIKDWQIIVHKPAIGINFIREYEGIKLKPSEICFLPLDNEKDPDALGLKLCIANHNRQQETKVVAGYYQMLDGLLGEKSVITNVHHVEVDKLLKNPEKKGLIELRELPKYLIWRKTKVYTTARHCRAVVLCDLSVIKLSCRTQEKIIHNII